MKFRSTLGRGPEVSLRDAVLHGSAPDGGLYMPVEMPRLPADFSGRLRSLSFPELSCEVGALFLGDDIPQDALTEIVTCALDFPVPLISLTERLHILELFHGPTLAFKDFGARFMARLMAYFVRGIGTTTYGHCGNVRRHRERRGTCLSGRPRNPCRDSVPRRTRQHRAGKTVHHAGAEHHRARSGRLV